MSGSEIISGILREIGAGLGENAEILIFIVSCAYLSAVFTGVVPEQSSLRDCLAFAVICLISVPVIGKISETAAGAGETIGEIRTIMIGSVPGLCAYNMSGAASGSVLFITLTQLAGALLSGVFLPLALIYSAAGICGSVTERFSLEGVKGTVRFVFTWGLGIMMTAFSCIAALSGALSGAKAGMAGRTLKYTGAMVPVVGRYLAESADMVFAGAAVLRSTAGLAAAAAIITAAAVPCIRMAANIIIFRLAAILIRPVSDDRITRMVNSAGDAFSMITGVTVLMSVMCVLNISVIMTLMKGGVQ